MVYHKSLELWTWQFNTAGLMEKFSTWKLGSTMTTGAALLGE